MLEVAIRYKEKCIMAGMQQVKVVGHAVPARNLKMYKTKLREAKQEKAALENDIIHLEEKIRKRDESKKRPANNVVPTSVRKQRRGEGGTSATSAVTNMSYDDDFSDDGSNEEENFDDGSDEEENFDDGSNEEEN